MNPQCDSCHAFLKKVKGQIKIISNQSDERTYSEALGKKIVNGSVLCNKCRQVPYTKRAASRCSTDTTKSRKLPNETKSRDSQQYAIAGSSRTSSSSPACSLLTLPTEPQTAQSVPELFGSRSCMQVSQGSQQLLSTKSSDFQPHDIAGPSRTCFFPTTFPSITLSTGPPTVQPAPELFDLRPHLPVSPRFQEPLSQYSEFNTSSSQYSSGSDETFTVPERRIQPERVFVELDIPRVVAVHKYCFLCGETKSIVTASKELRLNIYQRSKIFIPSGNRCCKSHFLKNRLYEDEISKLRVASNTCSIDVKEVADFLQHLADRSENTIHRRIGDFSFPEKRLKVFTGLNWEQFNTLRSMFVTMRNSSSRKVIQALVVLLMKLRTGNSNKTIAAILELDHEQQVSAHCTAVLNSFEKDILPRKFGLKATEVSREFLLTQTSAVAKKLYELKDDQLALVFDGTYVTHQKSSNNEYQRRSYSGQKKKPLCKPFTILTTNGFVIDAAGPFSATMNDAQIMEDVLKNYGLQELLKKGDVLIVDRGFRDVVGVLEDMGYIIKMPALKGKKSQLSTEQANDSRMVTMTRWVIEAVHGIIGQKYRLLHNQLDNKYLPKIKVFCQFACWVNNEFGKRLNAYEDLTDEILSQVNRRKGVINSLAQEVEEQGWGRKRTMYEVLRSDDIEDFPELTERDLKIFFTGSYQLSQSVSYLAEIMDEENRLNVKHVKETSTILRCDVRSRHINSRWYKSFIDYEPSAIGYSAIKRYCCDCANGNRTIGCCSHCAAIIYYLSHARYLSKIVRPAEILSSLFKKNELIPVINEDSDED